MILKHQFYSCPHDLLLINLKLSLSVKKKPEIDILLKENIFEVKNNNDKIS